MTVSSIGARARAQLARASTATVIALFDRACYLRTERDDVCCIVTDDIPPGPLHLTLSIAASEWRSLPLPVACTARRNGECLQFDELTIEYLNATDWRAPAHAGLHVAGWRSLDRYLRRYVLDGGDLASVRLRDCAASLCGSLSIIDGAAEEVSTAVGNLLGCGEGLTPAGDDYLCGVLLVLRALGLAEGKMLSEIVGVLAPGRTTRLSEAYLRAACEGEALAPFHEVVNELFAGCCREQTLARASAIGHSSGYWSLAGIRDAARWFAQQRSVSSRECAT